jgi:Rab-like protein 2
MAEAKSDKTPSLSASASASTSSSSSSSSSSSNSSSSAGSPEAEGSIGSLPDPDVKIILLGDSAVGKSKLVERFLMDEYNPRQLSTYALTLFRKDVKLDEDRGAVTTVDFWDTAGQEVG